ncbi:PqqD family protein [Novosphingobium sp. TH158]|uniref:PqqD family protein n=1 Tax=Novosphingobium sp. TH158 TaxID=2067455 RepID=UPI0013047195|nr:PqqD family protein [Novosphingobium sp. TH158]
MTEHTRISRRETVVSADVSDDAILLDIDSGYFFQLNRTAARIWRLLETPQTLGELTHSLRSSFPADGDAIPADLHVFVADLVDRGIVVAAAG